MQAHVSDGSQPSFVCYKAKLYDQPSPPWTTWSHSHSVYTLLLRFGRLWELHLLDSKLYLSLSWTSCSWSPTMCTLNHTGQNSLNNGLCPAVSPNLPLLPQGAAAMPLSQRFMSTETLLLAGQEQNHCCTSQSISSIFVHIQLLLKARAGTYFAAAFYLSCFWKTWEQERDFDSFYHDFCPGWKQSSCLKHFQMHCMANGTGETSSSSTQWHQQFWIFTASAGGCKSDPANQQLYSQQTNTLPSLPKGSELLSLWPVLCTEIKYLHLWAPEVCLTTSRPRSNLGWIEIMGLLYVAKWDRGATAAFWHSSWIKGGFASNKQCGHRTCSLVLPQNRDICLRGVGREQFYHLLFTLVSNFSTCWVILRYVHSIVHLILHCSFKETQFLIQLGPKAPSSDPKSRGR